MGLFNITAEPRLAMGTGASRRLRGQGKLPAIVYSGGQKPLNITLDANQINLCAESRAFFFQVLKLTIADQTEPTSVVIKAVQRSPINSRISHMDLLRVSDTDALQITVPLVFKGADVCVGTKVGGVIDYLLVDVAIDCLARSLPEYIEVDISALNVGETMLLSNLPLPPEVRLVALQGSAKNDQAIVRVRHAKK